MTLPGILCLALLCAVAVSQIDAQAFSNCDNESRICAGNEAQCQEGKCVCKTPFHGIPHLGCHRKAFKFCSLISDPKGTNFAREPHTTGIDLPLPCQYLAAHFTAIKNHPPSKRTRCQAKVFTSEERFAGKFFISGVYIELQFTKNPGASNEQSGAFSIQVTGSGFDGGYSYTLKTRPSLSGAFRNSQSLSEIHSVLGGGQQDEFHLVDNENRVKVAIAACGLEMYFRPADADKSVFDQTQMPGLLIGANEEDYEIVYNTGHAFCLSSSVDEHSVSAVTEQLSLDNEESFLYHVMTDQQTPQNSPEINSAACRATFDVMRGCQNPQHRKTAFESCSFMLLEPKFVNCFTAASDSGDLVALMGTCVHALCHNNQASCHTVQNAITGRACQDHVDVGLLMGFNCNAL